MSELFPTLTGDSWKRSLAQAKATPNAVSEQIAERAADVGPQAIQSDRPGHVTTVWRNGQVLRADQFGRVEVLPSVAPIFTQGDAA